MSEAGQTYEMQYKFSVDDKALIASGKQAATTFEAARKSAEGLQAAVGKTHVQLSQALNQRVTDQYIAARTKAFYEQREAAARGGKAKSGGREFNILEIPELIKKLAPVAIGLAGLELANRAAEGLTTIMRKQSEEYANLGQNLKEMAKELPLVGGFFRFHSEFSGEAEANRNALRNAERSQVTVQQYGLATQHRNEMARMETARATAGIGATEYGKAVSFWQSRPNQMYDPKRLELQREFGQSAGNSAFEGLAGSVQSAGDALIKDKQAAKEVSDKKKEVEQNEKELKSAEQLRRDAQARLDERAGQIDAPKSLGQSLHFGYGAPYIDKQYLTGKVGEAEQNEKTNLATALKEATDKFAIASKNLENSTKELRDTELKKAGTAKEVEQAALNVRRAQVAAYKNDLESQRSAAKGYMLQSDHEKVQTNAAMSAVIAFGANAPDDLKARASSHPYFGRWAESQATDDRIENDSQLNRFNAEHGIIGIRQRKQQILEKGGSDRDERIDENRLQQNFQQNIGGALERAFGRIGDMIGQIIDAVSKKSAADIIQRNQLNNSVGAAGS
jgi:hypothetical protein